MQEDAVMKDCTDLSSISKAYHFSLKDYYITLH